MPIAQILSRVLQSIEILATILTLYTGSKAVVPFMGTPSTFNAPIFDIVKPEPSTFVLPTDVEIVDHANPAPVTDSLNGNLSQPEDRITLISVKTDFSGVFRDILVTAERSDIHQFATDVTEAMSTSTQEACITNALRWVWLDKLATFEPFGYLLRLLAAIFTCHDYVVKSIYVACPAIILVGGAIFWGWLHKVKDIRKVVMTSQKLTESEKQRMVLEDDLTHVKSQMEAAQAAKERAEAQHVDVQKCLEETNREVIVAITNTNTAKDAQEEAEKALETSKEGLARMKAQADKLASINSELVSKDTESTTIINEQGRKISTLKTDNATTRTTNQELEKQLHDERKASDKAAKSQQKEAERLQKEVKDLKNKLHNSGQTANKLQGELKKQKTPKPEDVATLKSQLKAAEDKAAEAKKDNRHLTKVTKNNEDAANEAAKAQAAAEEKAARLEAETNRAAQEVAKVKEQLEDTEQKLQAAKKDIADDQAAYDTQRKLIEQESLNKDKKITELEEQLRAQAAVQSGASDAPTDNDDAAASQQDPIEPSEHGDPTSSGSTSSSNRTKRKPCATCERVHLPPCLACPKCKTIHQGPCPQQSRNARRGNPICRTCEHRHSGPCKPQIYCEICELYHADKECRKWCVGCQQRHWPEHCPVKKAAAEGKVDTRGHQCEKCHKYHGEKPCQVEDICQTCGKFHAGPCRKICLACQAESLQYEHYPSECPLRKAATQGTPQAPEPADNGALPSNATPAPASGPAPATPQAPQPSAGPPSNAPTPAANNPPEPPRQGGRAPAPAAGPSTNGGGRSTRGKGRKINKGPSAAAESFQRQQQAKR